MSNTTYPTTLDSPTNPTAANPTTSPAHHLQLGLENDAIVALETALGVTAAPGPLHPPTASSITAGSRFDAPQMPKPRALHGVHC